MSGTTRRPAARRLAGVLLFAVCLATALPASAATFDVVWTSPSGVAVAGNGLTKTAADGWNGEGAFASGTVVETYFIDFKTDAPSAATPELVCGLTRFGVSGLKPADIDFGLLLSGGTAEVYENGFGAGATVTYAAGDRFRIEAGLGFIRYRKNGVVFFRSIRKASATTLMVGAAAIYAQRASLLDVKMGDASDAKADDYGFLAYQVPLQRLDGLPLDRPTDASSAILTLSDRQASIVRFEACGRELSFLTTILQAIGTWPEHDTVVGEDVLGEAIAKLTWAAGLPDPVTGSARLTPITSTSLRAAPYPACTAVASFSVADLHDLAAALGSRLTIPAGGTAQDALYDDLVNHGAGVFNSAMRSETLMGAASPCPNVVTSTWGNGQMVTLEFTVSQQCLVAQITRVIGLMRVVDEPGSSKLPCNMYLGGPTRGEWDTTVKEALRFYYLAKRYELGPTHAPALDASVLEHIRNDILTIDGPPDCESYSVISCGCRSHETGSPEDRADDQSFADKVWNAAGDFTDWVLRHLFWFLIFLAGATLAGGALGLGLTPEAAVIVAAVGSLATGDTVRIPETENHLLLMNSARFLTNQIIVDTLNADGHDASTYEGYQRDVKEWLLKRMQKIVKEDFQEYNARPYGRYSMRALMNLSDFSEDDDVRRGANLVLQFAAAKASLGMNGGRRVVPLRRKTDGIAVNELMLQAANADFQISLDLLWAGQTEQLPDGMISAKAADEAVTAAASAFRPSMQALDLAVNKDTPYFQRIHHSDDDSMEAYYSSHGFLLSAGGLQTTSKNKLALVGIPIIGKGEDRGAAQPTVLIPTAGFGQINRSDLIQIQGISGEDDDPFDHNTCLWKGFACGVNITVPSALEQGLDCLGPPSTGESLRMLDSAVCPVFNQSPDPGYHYDRASRFYVAVYSRPCLPSSACNTFGFIDAISVGDPPSISFSDFSQNETNEMFKWRADSRSDLVEGQEHSGHFLAAGGDRIEFNPLGNKQDDEDSGIISVNDTPIDSIDKWPLASDDIITVLADGKLRIKSPHLPTPLILDFSDWSHPK